MDGVSLAERVSSDGSFPWERWGRREAKLADGTWVFVKTVDEGGADREELVWLVARAIGVPVPELHRVSPTQVVLEMLHGRDPYKGQNAEWRAMVATWEGQLIGLLDLLVMNNDRPLTKNWIQVGDRPYAIDHNIAFMASVCNGSVFRDHLDMRRFTEYRRRKITRALRVLRPEFERLGHLDWYEQMTARWREVRRAKPAVQGGRKQ